VAEDRDNWRVLVNRAINWFNKIREDFGLADEVLDFSSTPVYGVR
jgi:hypothetical protein